MGGIGKLEEVNGEKKEIYNTFNYKYLKIYKYESNKGIVFKLEN